MFLIAFPGVIIFKNDSMYYFLKSKYIPKVFCRVDVATKYAISENRGQDNFASSIVDHQEDRNESVTNFHNPGLHEPTIPGTELSVVKEYDETQENPVFNINLKNRHLETATFHQNEDNNSMANIDDPMPGCSHW